jgi:hypothetical protein
MGGLPKAAPPAAFQLDAQGHLSDKRRGDIDANDTHATRA